jgi:hypothetical protein
VTFYLGTHEPSWLTRTEIPLFVSRRRLCRQKSLPPARGPWALDSGGFSELSMFGGWRTGPEQYADEAMRYQREIGRLDFAAVQDWMCEPSMLERTGLSIGEHQARTIRSYLDLRRLAPGVPWAPVLQGWAVADYLDHADQYRSAGIDLRYAPRVGVGSVCRRQASYQAFELFSALKPLGLRLHGFGLKQGFLRHAFSAGLESFDSMAWSYRARRRGSPIEGCTHSTCANCMRYAIRWREALVSLGSRPRQELLMLTGEA